MKIRDEVAGIGAVVLMMCQCSVWPVVPYIRVGRCGECGVRPVALPSYEEVVELKRT